MTQYNVFTDFHHAGLLHSLILLFERRLGGKVFRPIGREWHEQGFWKIYDHPATVAQYLDVGGATPDNTPRLNDLIELEVVKELGSPLIYNCYDIDSGFTNKAITLNGFFSLPFNIVIASIPAHIEPFKKLCAAHPNHPKLIFQIGNAWTIEAGLAPNIMASAIINDVPQDINFISYHQEFDTKHFAFEKPNENKKISSFVNVFGLASHFAYDWQVFQEVERLMPDWEFKSYGGQCRDGAMHGAENVAREMKDCRYIWHTKAGGDGYGHIIHNAPAVGRPLIVNREYYRGKMAESLLRDGDTCITIEGLSAQEIVNKIETFNTPEKYEQMCLNAYNNFVNQVNFDKEEIAIRQFLEKLV